MKCIMINILGPGKKDAYEIKTGMQLWRQINRNAPRETSLYNKREIVGHLVSKKFGEGHKNFIPPTITGHLFVSTPTQSNRPSGYSPQRTCGMHVLGNAFFCVGH